MRNRESSSLAKRAGRRVGTPFEDSTETRAASPSETAAAGMTNPPARLPYNSANLEPHRAPCPVIKGTTV